MAQASSLPAPPAPHAWHRPDFGLGGGHGAAAGPALLLHGAFTPADPALEQYYRRQYSIKSEQAFACHQVVDLPSVTAPHAPHAQQQQAPPAAGSDWASYLRTLAGTLRAKVTP
jgi:hypothetical protein